MNYLRFAVFALMMSLGVVFAQDDDDNDAKKTPAEKAKTRVDWIIKSVPGLTPEQTQMISDLELQTYEGIAAVKSDEKLDGNQKNAKIRYLRVNEQGSLEKIMTYNQFQEYKKAKAERQNGKGVKQDKKGEGKGKGKGKKGK